MSQQRQPKSILKKTTGAGPFSAPAVAGPSKSSTAKFSQTVNVRVQKRKSPEVDDDDEEGEQEDDAMNGGEDDLSTDEEINRSKDGGEETKSKKHQKKKSTTTAETFGSTLTSLLSEPSKKAKKSKDTAQTAEPEAKKLKTSAAAPSNTILSLSHVKVPPSRTAEKVERKAKRHLKALKEEKEDKARIRDVVEGWRAADGTGGMEFEKGLRKVAQRGVIKLFNAILVASKHAEATKTSLSAKAGIQEEKGRRKEKDNVLGRGGKESALTQEGFLDLVRKG